MRTHILTSFSPAKFMLLAAKANLLGSVATATLTRQLAFSPSILNFSERKEARA